MSNFLNSFVPEKVTAVTMPVGSFDVIVKQVVAVTDHDANLSGAQKENYRFEDLHDQIAFTFVRLDGKPGIITDRKNTKGFVKFDEMSTKQQKSYVKDELTATNPNGKGYAISKKTGMRLEDPMRTANCASILNQLLNKLTKNGVPIIDELIADGKLNLDKLPGCTCNITVEEEVFNGKARNRVTKIRRVSAVPVLKPVSDQEEY